MRASRRGYLDRPELTAEKFIADPWSDTPGARLYRTGDRARYLPDGNIVFMGRVDHQVKLRGFRIELGEIETVLGGHPAVGQNAVIAREDTPGNKRLVAYVVARQGQSVSVPDLKAFIRAKLPEYMVPAAIVLIDSLPLTRTASWIARPCPRRIAPASMRRTSSSRRAPPSREKIAAIWIKVLARPAGGRPRQLLRSRRPLAGCRCASSSRSSWRFGQRLPLSVRQATRPRRAWRVCSCAASVGTSPFRW